MAVCAINRKAYINRSFNFEDLSVIKICSSFLFIVVFFPLSINRREMHLIRLKKDVWHRMSLCSSISLR